MISNSLFTQLVLACLAVALIFVYVKPTMENISETRKSIDLYKAEQERVSKVNERLALLINEINNIPASDQRALLTYMPDKVDPASVSRDIFSISQVARVKVNDIKISDSDDVVLENAPVPHLFTVVIEGSYENIKSFLSLIEQNEYPLEVHDMAAFGKSANEESSSNDLTVELEIVTYSRI